MLDGRESRKKAPDHSSSLAVEVYNRDDNTAAGQAVSGRSLDSSNSSFFSLANSTGFHTPLNDGSGQRSFFAHNGTHVTAAETSKQLVSSEFVGSNGLYAEVPIAHPKASRPRLSTTPPVARVPGADLSSVSLSNRGSQRHHLAFSDSPPPAKDSPLGSLSLHPRTAQSTGDLFATPTQRQRSAMTPPFSREVSHFPTFGLPPSQTSANTSALSNGSPSTPPPLSQEQEKKPSGSTMDQQRSSFLHSAEPDAACTDRPKNDGKTHVNNGAASSSSSRRTPALAVKSKSKPVSASVSPKPPQEQLEPAHRYQEANEEAATTAAVAPSSTPPNSTNTAAAPNATTTSTSLSSFHTVTDCTTRPDLARTPTGLSAEQIALLRSGPLLQRRTSVSAAPVVPPGWRPAVRERAAARIRSAAATFTKAPPTDASLEVTALSSSSPAPPRRLGYTAVDDKAGTGTSVEGLATTTSLPANKASAPHYPSVRFIYTRSGSSSKAASPDRPSLEPPRLTTANTSPPPSVVVAASPQQQQLQMLGKRDDTTPTTGGEGERKNEADAGRTNETKKSVVGHVFSTLRRHTAPTAGADNLTRRPTASVPFTRSSTFTAMQRRDSESVTAIEGATRAAVDDSASSRRHSEEVTGQRKPQQSGDDERGGSSRRGSREGAKDFDAAPQSYLAQWRQRQEERRAKEKLKKADTATAALAATAATEDKEGAAAAVLKGSSDRAKTSLATEPSSDALPRKNSETVPPEADKKETKPQLSAPATNASWKRAKEDVAVHAAEEVSQKRADGEDNVVTAASAISAVATVTTSKEASTESKPYVAYSLSEALCSHSIPNAAATTSATECSTDESSKKAEETTTTTASAHLSANAETGETAVSLSPPPLSEAKLSTAQPNKTPEATQCREAPAGAAPTVVAVSPQYPPQQHQAQQPASSQPTSNTETVSPTQTSASVRRASRLSNSSYQTEDYVRRASADEDIPEDQVGAAATTTTPTASSHTPSQIHNAKETSPRLPPKKQSTAPTTETAHEPSATAPPLQSRQSATSARHSSSASRATTERTEDGGKTTPVVSVSGDVRDLCRAVLERREQRLQQQQSARHSTSERTTPHQPQPQPQTSLPPPPAPPPLPQVQPQQQEEEPNTTEGINLKADSIPPSRSSSKTATTTSARHRGRVTPYTPPWKTGLPSGTPTGATAALSRPPSAPPEATPASAAADTKVKSATSTLPATRAATPAAPSHCSHLTSLATAALQRSALPSRSATPSPAVGNASFLPDGATSAAVVMAAKRTHDDANDEDEDDDDSTQPSSRLSQLLARRSSFTNRLSAVGGTDAASAAAAVLNASFDQAPAGQPEKTSTVASTEVTALSSAAGSSAVASARLRSKATGTAPSSAADTPSPQTAFNMAAALDSIPTAADIEREARLSERQALIDAHRRPSAEPEKERTKATPTPAAPDEQQVKEKKSAAPTNIHAATASTSARAPTTTATSAEKKPQPMPVFAARPLTSPPLSNNTSQEASAAAETKVNATLPTTPLPSPTPAKPSVKTPPAAHKRAPSTTALGEIPVDELDKLEQSVNAMLKQYGKSTHTSSTHPSPAKEETPSKPTAADLLLSQMPEHAKTTASKAKAKAEAAAAASRLHHAKASKVLSMELSGSSSRHHHTAGGSEWDDEDSHWDASVLWCGEESDVSDRAPPPMNVPPLDLTTLLLPTGEYEDLKPYRIPLPSAVPAPEENRRHLFRLAGVLSTASGSPDGDRDIESARSSGLLQAGASTSSATLNATLKASSSVSEVSPFVGERIRRMKDQPAEPPAAVTAARNLRASRRASRALSTEDNPSSESTAPLPKRGAKGHAIHPIANNTSNSNSSGSDHEDDSIHELVDEAPQRISRVVRFTDDSDALDGGRGAARELRVGQQKNRVRLVLLDCDEQRERKALQTEETSAFAVITKSFRRSSLLA